jgi:hypothetical protein
MKKKNKYLKAYKKQRPTFNFLTKLIKFFSKKYEIIDLNNGEIKDNCIFISNHSAANGPLMLTLNLPLKFIPWGINDMCQGYRVRRRYLIDIFYGKKLKYSKFRSKVIGTLFAIISGYLYRNAGVIPTFENASLQETMKLSIEKLKNGKNILIFPEDSSNGYFDVLTKYYPGFAMLSKLYFKKTNKDLPVYPIYISKKKKIIIVGKPLFINEMLNQNFTLEEIAEKAKNITNELYDNYIKNK